jgi:CheY-like chemotaxis protein
MSTTPTILVATEVVGDADLVRKLLRDEFDKVVASTDPDASVRDFEKHRPDVLVLAFDGLEKAERYYLGLYRLSSLVHALPHRTLILCTKDDLRRVYELCKKEYFDDYVLFWPMTHDAPRLPMSVHHALRQQAAALSGVPTASEFAAQARRIAAMESLLEQHATSGDERIDRANRSLRRAQQDIGSALDGFAHRLSQGELREMVDVKDETGFQREIDRLKTGEIAAHMESVAEAVRPVSEWAGDLREKLAPQFQSARALRALADRVRPLVLVVDDDELQHKLLRHLLQEVPFELSFAGSGMAALATLRRRRPDLILMDVQLPDINGIEATRRIKAVDRFAAVPVLMVTGNSDKNAVIDSVRAGAAGFIVKPFDKDVLVARIRGCLSGIETAAS